MLYEKCRGMLEVSDYTTRNLSELDIVRRALSLLDKKCLQLSLKDVELLWGQYTEWHGTDYIPIDKTWIKRFLKWIYNENFKDEALFIKVVNSLDGIDAL